MIMAKGNKVELATFLVGERTESLVTNQRKIMLCSSVIMAKGNKVELATFLVASNMPSDFSPDRFRSLQKDSKIVSWKFD